MGAELFKASRWTRGNHMFPIQIEVTDRSIIRRKYSWMSCDEISISLSKVASVHVRSGLMWADILIESTGGSDPFTSHGHYKKDARRIKELIEDFQSRVQAPPPTAAPF